MSGGIRIDGVLRMTQRLQAIAKQFPRAVQAGARDGAEHMRAYMADNYLSGQRLNVRTDKLRGGFSVRNLESPRVGAAIVTATRYAPVHEYGFTGAVNVREHIRRKQDDESLRGDKRRARNLANRYARKLGPKGQILRRQEAKARAQAMADPGTRTWRNSPGLRGRKLGERRARGVHGGVAGSASAARRSLADARNASGSSVEVVRAHQRWMRVPAKRYARDTIRNDGKQAVAIMRARIRREVFADAR